MTAVRIDEDGFHGMPELTRYQAIQVILESLGEHEVLGDPDRVSLP